jgi:hypothetical protein
MEGFPGLQAERQRLAESLLAARLLAVRLLAVCLSAEGSSALW